MKIYEKGVSASATNIDSGQPAQSMQATRVDTLCRWSVCQMTFHFEPCE